MKTLQTYNLEHILSKNLKKYNCRIKKNFLEVNKIQKNKKLKIIKIPKKISISPEAVGLIVGEGYLGGRSFIFANSNENAIKIVLKFLKQFKIPIRIYLEISTKNTHKTFLKNCKKYWEDTLHINLTRIRERKEFNNITKHGTIHICINGKIICELINFLIKDSKQKMEKNKKLAIGYLKGILAAEGNINAKSSTKCLYMVRISASKKEEREHYKRCLQKGGIDIYCKDMPTVSKEEARKKGWKTTKGRAGCVIISKWENFVKILELNLLEINEEKREKFIKHFINNKFTRQFLSFKFFLDKKFTMKEAQKLFNFKGRKVDRVLTLWKAEYLKRYETKPNRFKYKLTKKYLKLYKKINSEINLFKNK